VRALRDLGGLVVRTVDSVESSPMLDAWLTATGGPYAGMSRPSMTGLTYADSVAPLSSTVGAYGYGSTSGLSLDWFSASLIESASGNYLGSWPLAVPSMPNAVTLFVHGSLSGASVEGLRLLQCDDHGRPSDGLTPCIELPFQCAPPDRDGGSH
jgi:hypothetical protein